MKLNICNIYFYVKIDHVLAVPCSNKLENLRRNLQSGAYWVDLIITPLQDQTSIFFSKCIYFKCAVSCRNVFGETFIIPLCFCIYISSDGRQVSFYHFNFKTEVNLICPM